MDLQLPPSPPPSSSPGYHTVEEELVVAPPPQSFPTLDVPQATPTAPKLHYDRLLLLLIFIAAIGAGGYYGIRWGYTKLTAKEQPQLQQEVRPDFFSYTTTLSNQPFLFTLPTSWVTAPSLDTPNAVAVFPGSKELLSKKKPSPAFIAEMIPLSSKKSAIQLTSDYVAPLPLGTYIQAIVSVGRESPSGMVITRDATIIITALQNGKYYLKTTIPTLDAIEDTNLVTPVLNLFKQSVRFD